jgi:histidyl-tRNA synthetase
MRVQKSKGTRDFLPEEMIRFRHIEGIFRDVCLKWGYREIRTPTVEYLHLFTAAGTLTPGTLSKVYSFLDWDGWSGERVVLRPDGTIPVARLYIDHLSGEKLARLFYVTNIFAFEETGKESREKWQCGVELIGADSTAADVELITIALQTLRQIGLKNVDLKLSHAGLIRALLAGFGLSPEEQGKVFDQILDGDLAVLARLRDQTPDLVRLLTPLLDLKGESSSFLKNLRAVFNRDLPEFSPALDSFIAITDLLTALGQKYEIDIASGRGFEYYTGVIFQVFAGDARVAAGGRYDALIPLLGGDNVPASGFALYLEPLMSMVKSPRTESPPGAVLVRPQGNKLETAKLAHDVVARLHGSGVVAHMDVAQESEVGNYQWLLYVRESVRPFKLVDSSGKTRAELPSVDAVIRLFEGKNAG